MVGKIAGVFSNAWNFSAQIFQGLEIPDLIFPTLGNLPYHFFQALEIPGEG
jgi:hypothetical protein